MNKEQTDFSDAVLKMNCNNLIFALSKGAEINKSNTKKNTINFAIRVLLSHPVKLFNTKFLETLLDHGAKFCNSSDSNANTLESIIRYKMYYYIEKAKLNNDGDMAKKNILELLNLILSSGAKPGNCKLLLEDIMNHRHGIELEIVILLCKYKIFSHASQTNNNVLNYAIKINNLVLLRILCRYEDISPNVTQNVDNTLSCAVKTNNIEIVKIICENQGRPNILGPNMNTLDIAILTKNPEIISEIIIRGGKPCNDIFGNSWYDHTFGIFYYTMREYGDVKIFDRVINLLMCSGIMINDQLFLKIAGEEVDSYYKRKISSCYYLLYSIPCTMLSDEELQDKNDLRKELTLSMKELMEGSIPKRIIVEQVDIGTQICIPVPCIEMIYEYQHTASLVQYIDWSKY